MELKVTTPSAATYHYRLVAISRPPNSDPIRVEGADVSFQAVLCEACGDGTPASPPSTTTGEVQDVTRTSAVLQGRVNPNDGTTETWFEVWVEPTAPQDRPRTPRQLIGNGVTPVEIAQTVLGLEPGTTYHYRIVASGTGGEHRGEERTFQVGALIGLRQQFPQLIPSSERAGELLVTLHPPGIGAYRFEDAAEWLPAGVILSGLPTGDRTLEFRPEPGHLRPAPVTVSIVSGAPPTIVERTYYTGTPDSGTLTVTLQPANLADPSVPEIKRPQWRIAGHPDPTWKNSGVTLTQLPVGNYLIECKPIPGRGTPTARDLLVTNGLTATATIAYLAPNPTPPTLAAALDFKAVSTSPDLPYGYVGQLHGSHGSFSGFVVKPRVVATAAQAVFDEETLSIVTELQWKFQRDRGTYEPAAQIPRGFYSFDSYAALRESEGTPGEPGIASQNYNVAALYFRSPAGRDGFSGFLASDNDPNEFLGSSLNKTLVGYPVGAIPPENQGRMHATPLTTASLVKVFDRTHRFKTNQSGGLGFVGGPLCVQLPGGPFYPAAIHLGGPQGLARAIDSRVIDLFGRAQLSSTGGENNTSGGITHTSFLDLDDEFKFGALRFVLEPAEAAAHGGWSLVPEPAFRNSGNALGELTPGLYDIRFKTVPGFALPTIESVTVEEGRLRVYTFRYAPALTEIQRWRLQHFGTPDPLDSAAEEADPDGDGRRNKDEFEALTDPNNSADFFKVDSVSHTGNQFAVNLSGRVGRRYELQLLTKPDIDPSKSRWEAVDSAEVTGTEALGTPKPLTLTHQSATSLSGIYRVAIPEKTP